MEIVEKKSRFIARVFPIKTEEEAAELLEKIRENMIIIDDESTGLDMFSDRLLKPDGLIGLTEDDYRRAITDLRW